MYNMRVLNKQGLNFIIIVKCSYTKPNNLISVVHGSTARERGQIRIPL